MLTLGTEIMITGENIVEQETQLNLSSEKFVMSLRKDWLPMLIIRKCGTECVN